LGDLPVPMGAHTLVRPNVSTALIDRNPVQEGRDGAAALR